MRAHGRGTLRIAWLGLAVLIATTAPLAAQTGTVSGRVTDALTGSPLADVFVNVYDATGSYVTSAPTDAGGNYAAGGVPAGTAFARTWNEIGYVDELYD